MARIPKLYQRLPGRGAQLFSRIELHQGADHLLLVTTTGFTQKYKRFFFQDIQAITLHKTVAGAIGNAVLAWVAVMFGVPAMLSDSEAAIGLWFVAGIFAAFLVWNVVAGPTCACYIQTAVQQQRLHSLKRIRQTRKVISRLKPLLAEAQTRSGI